MTSSTGVEDESESVSREEGERMSADIDAVLEDTSQTRKSRHETARSNATPPRAGQGRADERAKTNVHLNKDRTAPAKN